MKLSSAVGKILRGVRGGDKAVDGLKQLARTTRTKILMARNGRFATLNCGGIMVCGDLENPTHAWYDGSSENLERDRLLFRQLLPFFTGSVYVDIGAHFGYFAAMFDAELTAANRAGRIVAVEPDPDAFYCLQQTVESNQLPTVCIHAAAGAEHGTTFMYRGTGSCLHSYLEPGAQLTAAVQEISLPELCVEIDCDTDVLAFVKIDVDGFEPVVMKGATEVLKKHEALVLIEFAPAVIRGAGGDARAFFEQLCGNFTVHWVDWQRNPIRRVAVEDYDAIVERVGCGITDLLLSTGQIPNDLFL